MTMDNLTFEVTTENFREKVLGAQGPVLVEFTAAWCPPCRMIAPLVAEIARKYEGRLAVGVLDTDAHPEISPAYQVFGLPTLIVFQGGQEVRRIVGFRPKRELEAAVTGCIEKAEEMAG